MLAASLNNECVVKEILSVKNVEANLQDALYKVGFTALHWGVKNKNLSMIYEIMKYAGINPNL